MLRRFARWMPVLFLVMAITGCTPSKSDIEKSIREEMKTSLNVTITSIDLQKQADGTYTGSATADNGNTYEVTTSPPKDNKVEWKAIPGQAAVEKVVKEGIEKQIGSKVKSLNLSRTGPGIYSGPAELESGIKVLVKTKMEGTQLLWEANQIKEAN